MSVGLPIADPAPKIQMRTLEENALRRFWRKSLAFVLLGAVIYLAIYFAADQLVYQTAKRNRFFNVKTGPVTNYDVVILGASHAAVFDYEDMNAQLEQMTGKKIINLSIVGSGITVNRLLLDYFLAQHRTQRVVYFLDTFALTSQDWNEDRFQDVRLFDRAPFDPVLVRLLCQNPASQSIALDYTLGFSKINNPDRFKPDVTDDEATKFRTTYRPVKQIDSQRISYLYPKPVDAAVFQRYLDQFVDMVQYLKSRNVQLIVIKPPLPERMYQMLPNEAEYDAAIKPTLERHSVEFYDYSLVNNDEKFFFNPDHLNRTGVLSFFQDYLVRLLAR